MKRFLSIVVCGCLMGAAALQAQAPPKTAAHAAKAAPVLAPEDFHHYFTTFIHQEEEATGKPGADSWQWMAANIPWFESSNKEFEEIYYFRWYSFQKHIVHTDAGDVIDEFLFKVKWAGYGNTVAVAVPHQLREARWTRDKTLAESDARFWLSPLATHNHDFSLALSDAARSVTLANGDTQFAVDLLPRMVDYYKTWEKANQDSNGLFWSIDTRDGMEVSISGDGYRPTLNSYMYGDAKAIERLAAIKGDTALSQEYAQKADEQKARIESLMWNPSDNFYEVLSPLADSGIRQRPKFKDKHLPPMTFADVREAIGFIPWYFDIPAPEHAVAWKQLYDPQGFAGAFGPSTAERRSPRFLYANADQCQWNGYMWGFTTTQTLVGLANLLNDQKQDYVSNQDYLNLFSAYVRSHRLRLPNGDTIPWLDESMDPNTGEWVTRRLLKERNSPLAGRGAYYDHSGFIDPLITGLIGLRPRDDNRIILNPLLPPGAWDYFALDGLPYHGHILTIVYDKAGQHYHRGAGLRLLIDGRLAASRPELGPLQADLPATPGHRALATTKAQR